MHSKRIFNISLLLPALFFLLVFLLLPVLLLIVTAFRNQDADMNLLPGYTVSRYVLIFTTPSYLNAIVMTIGIALLTTLICLVAAYPAAYLLTHARNRTVHAAFYVILVSPLLTSVVVRTFSWIVLLAQNGLVNQFLEKMGIIHAPLSLLWNMPAVIVAYVQVMLPFAVMPLVTTMGDISPSLSKASMSLGVGKVRTFFHVTMPLTIPGLVSGGVIVFSLTAGSYITPLLIGGGRQPFLSLLIYQQAIQLMDLPMAGALSTVLMILVFVIILPIEILLKRWEAKVYG